MSTRTALPTLLEREQHLEILRGARRGADGRGRLVLVAGEAGVGKTSLVRSCCAEAAARSGARRTTSSVAQTARGGHRR